MAYGSLYYGLIVHAYRGITLSALASTLGGIVSPICLAAFKFMMNSNFLGCSTGGSAGLAPFEWFADIHVDASHGIVRQTVPPVVSAP
jgi:hypothetical protein